MTGVVVDASLVVAWFANEKGSEAAAALLDPAFQLSAPDIMIAEVANALWAKVLRGDMTSDLVQTSLESLLAIDIELVETRRLVGNATAIALEHRRPVYDALYVSLAAERGLPLATSDRRLARLAGSLASTPVELWQLARAH